jgi:hypothetical protein
MPDTMRDAVYQDEKNASGASAPTGVSADDSRKV